MKIAPAHSRHLARQRAQRLDVRTPETSNSCPFQRDKPFADLDGLSIDIAAPTMGRCGTSRASISRKRLQRLCQTLKVLLHLAPGESTENTVQTALLKVWCPYYTPSLFFSLQSTRATALPQVQHLLMREVANLHEDAINFQQLKLGRITQASHTHTDTPRCLLRPESLAQTVAKRL